MRRAPVDTTSGARLTKRATPIISPSARALAAMHDSPPRKELIQSNYGARGVVRFAALS